MGRTILLVAAAVAVAVAGCGGGGSSSKLSNDDLNKLTSAGSAITGYCVQGAQSQLGGGSGQSLGQLNQAVSTLVDEYKAHPNASVQFTPIARKQSMKTYLRQQENQLGSCGASDQASRLEQAISGG